MLFVLFAALDALSFTAELCLWGAVTSVEVVYWSCLVLVSILSSILSVTVPAALNVLEYGFLGVSYALGVIVNAIVVLSQYSFSLLQSAMLYFALLLSAILQVCARVLWSVAELDWLGGLEIVGTNCMMISQKILSGITVVFSGVMYFLAALATILLNLTATILSGVTVVFNAIVYYLAIFGAMLLDLSSATCSALVHIGGGFIKSAFHSFYSTFDYLLRETDHSEVAAFVRILLLAAAAVVCVGLAYYLVGKCCRKRVVVRNNRRNRRPAEHDYHLLHDGTPVAMARRDTSPAEIRHARRPAERDHHLLHNGTPVAMARRDTSPAEIRRRRIAAIIDPHEELYFFDEMPHRPMSSTSSSNDARRRGRGGEQVSTVITAAVPWSQGLGTSDHVDTKTRKRDRKSQRDSTKEVQGGKSRSSNTIRKSEISSVLRESQRVLDLEKKLREEVEAKQCVVCLDNPREMMIRPCNHYCVCEGCCNKLNRCPICTRCFARAEKIFNV